MVLKTVQLLVIIVTLALALLLSLVVLGVLSSDDFGPNAVKLLELGGITVVASIIVLLVANSNNGGGGDKTPKK